MIVPKGQFHQVLESLSKPGVYSLDTETTGLKETDRLFSIAIHTGTQGYYFNFQDYPGVDPELVLPREWLKYFLIPLSQESSTWLIHNAKFDMRMLAYENLFIQGKVICTQATERIVKNNYFGGRVYSLEKCAERRGMKKDDAVEAYITEHKLWDLEEIPGRAEPNKLKKFYLVPLDIISKYALIDAEVCYQIGVDQALKIAEMDKDKGPTVQNISNIYTNENNLTKVCFKMERLGIKIDRSYVSLGAKHHTEQLGMLQDKFKAETGVEFLDSRDTLKEIFDKLGEEYPETAKGNASFTSEVLESFDSPLGQLVCDIRHHHKMLGTYYSSFLYHADSGDIIHPTMNQAGTETGRFSYSNPNLQNVPKQDEGEFAYYVRKCFVPREGFFFLSMDYKQQEFRMMLDYAGQKALIARINNGEDVHQATADLLGISRKFAKTVNFGLLYGMGIGKLAKSLKISEKDAKELKSMYFEKLPGVQRFLWQCADKAREQGYVTNWLGRRCHVSDPKYAYIMPNHIIQGGAADTIKLGMNRIQRHIDQLKLKSRMVLQVHDEILFEFSPDELDQVGSIKTIMENVYKPKNAIRLDVDVEHSFKSWAAIDKIKGIPNGTPTRV